ncbi:DegQ family serine endoprotease [Campylobacter sp. MIT 97-5078]|uniref:DegQ family serine endoprotease n=1 Tax=Campylobacter sp. MIT 97-5078 TaxID=1548153 RepID=UPI0005136407|nr:DegQ family serine endoprotease [Campylobacter sp. MIT 97-5078]KGI56011.1 serine protease [Campylobacter sp. MIT 97-5078]TQR23552.1 DegQ family serine endoprotease [Campylobacter sp. MIT 97-5078]
MKKKMFLLSLCASCVLAANINFEEAPKDIQRADPSTQTGVVLSYHDAIKNVKKSVVNISTSKTVTRNMAGLDDFFNDPYFKQFFGFDFPQQKGGSKKEVISSLGSGVIISSDGYIITNNHVIADVDSISVSLPDDDTEYKAKLVGADEKTDLAVIKIEAKNLSAVSFADSDKLMEGDMVFALGNPFGVGSSVTSGIVSALNKNNIGLNQYENFIQTDASINPGNSGGALVDSRGALVGINSAILSRSGGNNGIGFAIPSNMVKDIAKRLVEKGKIERGFLGVTITNLEGETKKAYSNQSGALITSVEKGSSAELAGLKRGDLVLKVNEKNITSANDLKNYIGTLEPNQKITIIYERDGVSKSVSFVLKADTQSISSQGLIDGLELKNLDANTRAKIPANINGVLVTGVKEDSKADNAGFEVGDIIIGVEQDEIKNLEQLSSVLKNNQAKSFTKIWVYRNGVAQLLVLR